MFAGKLAGQRLIYVDMVRPDEKRRRTVKGEAVYVRRWIERQEKMLRDAVKDGPVLVS